MNISRLIPCFLCMFVATFIGLGFLFPSLHMPLMATALICALVGVSVCAPKPAPKSTEVLAVEQPDVRLQGLRSLIHKYDSTSGVRLTVSDNIFDELEQGIREIVRNGRAVIENALDVICTIDAENRFMSVNASSKSILGYSPDELIGRRFTDFLSDEDVSKSVSAAMGASKSLDKVSIENKWKRKDGFVIDLLWSAHWSSQASTLFCVIHDITDRKQAEQLLRLSEETLRTILNNLPLGVVLSNEEGTIGYANPNASTITKVALPHLTGENLTLFFPAARFQEKLKEAVTAIQFEANLHRATGEIIPVEVIISPLQRNLRGTTRLVVFTDISERKRIEQSKREIAAMVSHELKTPLSAVQITLDLLGEGSYGALSEKGASMVKKGAAEVSRIVRLIQDMLDFEKLNTGAFTVHPSDTSLQALVNSSVEAVRPLADERNIQISVVLKEDVEVNADGIRIIQVVINLLSNAIKFSPDKSTIRVGAVVDDQEARVFVEDKGRGIPESHLPLIFKKYHQVEASDHHQLGGSGLGLAIVSTIIEKHEGQMGVESVYGKGSTFWFTLKLAAE